MVNKNILIKTVVSEKAELLSENKQQYTFVVNKDANKIQIRKAVEDQYGVTVERVNTLNTASKRKNRSTKSGILRGRVGGVKKAVVTLTEGDVIDLYNEY